MLYSGPTPAAAEIEALPNDGAVPAFRRFYELFLADSTYPLSQGGAFSGYAQCWWDSTNSAVFSAQPYEEETLIVLRDTMNRPYTLFYNAATQTITGFGMDAALQDRIP